MAVWAIGDIQGCYGSFRQLLDKIAFDPTQDTLWIAGDVVNRGEGSLETLEYLYSLKERVQIVLGNHDITLIAAYYGIKKSNPTLDSILQSPRAKILIDWLRSQKFLHVDYQLGYCMAHAGISPEFDLGMALRYAQRIEEKMGGDDAEVWLRKILKSGVDQFNREASLIDIDRYLVSAFTRMRYCYKDHKLDFDQKGAPTDVLRQKGLKPWFECKDRKEIHLRIIIGHWSTLGLYQDEHILAIDTGCLWGGSLTAARIDTHEVEFVSVACEKRLNIQK
ncbi:MAG TPA: symmetrical bis(5'-nucleosyl)-tetraphosphatase [Sulfurovum sp.]|nr:MAG: bis(5'-nucleosyl)-tetraphosphatase (symmetrical) [Sulfurovum sp. 35-42-20]OYZ24872.1 MAG: bis(5'-nucleosyl)-tetraphosphatase (symmetrical) [Sulfurovum sp. 16-42-52]OYZ50345.1 MAG: bis(5'-nucleosyl)-tetraphosphatase (symmetrical) [Sulfurovum sp. 24-42-9]OZA44572.1 MAG: bis(5'-nucleosyl)-tetraphosphatase (symmetrical) [Sulfurovum sp. 17-42-90]OZA61480.1 MAG: bis(5'-nucleosyl)-tetraphosphatase (symmetrical) [Sulfurovum sp. 39-42-12]HQR73780.1 symmetrical bis(5'-nucleosyl)-tetraphosphatase